MATATIYCAAIHNWNNDDDYWEYNGYPIVGSLKGQMFNNVTPSFYRLGLQRMTFGALPEGTITAATFHGQSWAYSGSSSNTIYFQASDDADEWHTTEPPDTVSEYMSFSTTRTAYDFDITDQLIDYGTGGNPLYVYAFRATELELVDESNVWDSSGTLPYIEITYTPPSTSTIGLYNGSSFTNRIIKKWNGSAWVQCDCYKYVSGSWVKASTT